MRRYPVEAARNRPLGSQHEATAVPVSGDAGLAPGGDAAATVQLLFQLSADAWGVGALCFGLWLIPMDHVAASSGRMPGALGGILIVGGVGYILSAFVDHGLTEAPTWLVEGLTIPVSVGAFWMIGYLLSVGIRPAPDTAASSTRAPQR